MMREIPSLQVLCLRSIGSPSCSVEHTFGRSKDGEISTASRLLRSFHQRAVASSSSTSAATSAGGSSTMDTTTTTSSTTPPTTDQAAIHNIPMERTPCIGTGSARRVNANDVDLHHPVAASLLPSPITTTRNANSKNNYKMILQHGNPALDCLQSYPDSLVELGRMNDTRLGVQFFREWRCNVLLAAGEAVPVFETAALDDIDADESKKNGQDDKAIDSANASTAAAVDTIVASRKRRRSGTPTGAPTTTATTTTVDYSKVPTSTLSLYNCTLTGGSTIAAMVNSGMGPHVSVLDLTGTHGLTDASIADLMPTMPNLTRLSVKNCRRITDASLEQLAAYCPHLQSIDVGGAFNMTTDAVLQAVPRLTELTELHASGMGWTNESVAALCSMRRDWQALSFGFSLRLTQTSLRQSLMMVADSLVALSLPFCESVVDNAVLGMLGRNLPAVRFLDLRGNPSLSTVTGWYDGRASADLPPQDLLVLARYSGLQEPSVEETRRIHPLEASKDRLNVVLDGGGMGAGICRVED